MYNVITVALPKGRMADESIELMQRASLIKDDLSFSGRKLSVVDTNKQITFFLVRSQDVATYVENGVADLGIVGKDVLLEQELPVYELLDLGFGYCRISLAGNKQHKNLSQIRVATKYPKITEAFFSNKGKDVEIIKLYGSIELAPLTGLADFIVDLVSSGQTLQENNLIEMETILESTGRLIGNRAAYVMKNKRIQEIVFSLQNQLTAS